MTKEGERYAWCQNPRCWRFGENVPIKYGRTMTCVACGERWPVYEKHRGPGRRLS